MSLRVSVLPFKGLKMVSNVDAVALFLDSKYAISDLTFPKEVAEYDLGLFYGLCDLRKTLTSASPLGTVKTIESRSPRCRGFLLSSQPARLRGAKPLDKVTALNANYKAIFATARRLGISSLVLPIQSFGDRYYGEKVVMHGLLSALADFHRLIVGDMEVCILATNAEVQALDVWFSQHMRNFGLDFVYRRESADFSINSLRLV
jgi:hypothetical protein